MRIIDYFYLRAHWRSFEVSKGQKVVKNGKYSLEVTIALKEVSSQKYTKGCNILHTNTSHQPGQLV